jgi:hypothetical protein
LVGNRGRLVAKKRRLVAKKWRLEAKKGTLVAKKGRWWQVLETGRLTVDRLLCRGWVAKKGVTRMFGLIEDGWIRREMDATA